jgi:hypothetical protein
MDVEEGLGSWPITGPSFVANAVNITSTINL